MIRILIHVVSSKRDIYGNCYHAAIITRVSDGTALIGTINSDSNARFYVRKAGIEWDSLHETSETLPIRQYNRYVKGFKHLSESDINEFVKESKAI